MHSGENQLRSFLVGIDLGTTHSVVAYAELLESGQPGPIQLFSVWQQVSAQERAPREALPSFLYYPLEGERDISSEETIQGWVAGEFARERGREVLGRQIASAKSWLGHRQVDRTAAILPWGSGDEELSKLSPVEASALILVHIRDAWNQAHPNAKLEHQQVILTVPASFDQGARELTLRAVKSAGLQVRLLEEPQAAFYAFLADQGEEPLDRLLEGKTSANVLVCDVGGGTTDLTLIRVSREDERAEAIGLSRFAVGNHILLGGDNLDLALAQHCERQMLQDGAERLDPARFSQLVAACRGAKERLLSPEAPEELPVRLLGQGSALLGNTLRASIRREFVESLLLDGFLPRVGLDERPKRGRSGLMGFGLPYEADPAITRHIAWFLRRHMEASAEAFAAPEGAPAAVLLNGGLFLSELARERIEELLSDWLGAPVQLLKEADPSKAVARGAVYYGLALGGHGVKIAGGSARGYYIGVDAGEGLQKGICVVPKGATEGEVYRAESYPLSLTLGRTVRFPLFASNDSSVHAPGAMVELEDSRFIQLPSVTSSFIVEEPRLLLPGQESEASIRVGLVGELSAIGTLELACEELTNSPMETRRRFQLAFDLREVAGGDELLKPADAGLSEGPNSLRLRAPGAKAHPRLAQAQEAILRVYGKGRADVKPREIKDLVRELERLLGERKAWSLELNRALFDCLMPHHGARRRSAEHERVFWLLVGSCLRPGFGFADDEQRSARVGKLVSAGLIFHTENRNWQALWIAWRRIAGGLPEAAQQEIRDLVDPFLAPAEEKLKKPKKLRPSNPVEMLELASSLERLPETRRAQLGRWVLERTWTDRDARLWEALARIGGRIPMYASAHHVIAPRTVERWLDHMLRERWEEVPSAAAAAVSLARVTGDRARDLSEAARAEVAERLMKAANQGMPIDALALEKWLIALKEYVPHNAGEHAHFFGEELPVGLRLLSE